MIVPLSMAHETCIWKGTSIDTKRDPEMDMKRDLERKGTWKEKRDVEKKKGTWKRAHRSEVRQSVGRSLF